MKKTHHDRPVEPGANSHGVIHEIIAARAHEMWEQDGKPEHRADDFWLAAEQEQVTGKRKADPILPVKI